jgi:hypothetical protein
MDLAAFLLESLARRAPCERNDRINYTAHGYLPTGLDPVILSGYRLLLRS